MLEEMRQQDVFELWGSTETRRHARNMGNSALESQDWRLWACFKAGWRDGAGQSPDSWFISLLQNITEPRGPR